MTDSLTQIAIELTRAIVPIIMFIGIIGNSLNITVLTRPVLYNHACSRYFLALSCNNLFFTSVMLTYRLLADGYQRDVTKVSLLSCKLVTYIFQVSLLLSAYFIVLASIDRYCASSTNVHLRKFSNVKITRWMILFIIIIIMLFYINTVLLVDLRLTDTFGCHIRGDTIYKQVYPIIQVVLFTIIAPGLMALFGIMTIYNAKRVHVIPTALSRYRRTENQLAGMLLLQVGTHIVLVLPTAATYLMLDLPNPIESTSAFYLARMVTQYFLYLSFATPFFLYVISARTYRKELVQLLCRIFRLRGINQIYPNTNTITNTMVPINTMIHKLSQRS
jgi:hypothetical protein